ncbi:MAG: cysteine desulfurase NifS [Planctomycetota bacterium]|nr:cysteine desulfurase NifS [Planctomycetota bacterium]
MKTIYLDNNATTCVAPEVLDAMMPYFTEKWGNPSSIHSFGGRVKRDVERAREQVAALLNAEPSEIVFTSCGSESDNMAIRGAVEAANGKIGIITTRVEHPAVLGICRYLGSRGCRVTELPVDSLGRLDMAALDQALTDGGRAVVSTMWANNETGVIFPIAKIAEKAKAAGCVMHTDAVQAVGKIPIDLRKVPVDMLSLSGHKLHAPKGVGALFVRRGTRVNPLIFGGHQEGGRRAGTENVPYIIGLGRACELAMKNMQEERTRVAAMRDRLEKGILETCPDARVNGDRDNRLPNTLNVSFEYVEGEAILLMLNDLGICASSGSACTSGSLEPSHVMRAMGVPFTAAHGSIRFSFSRYNTEEDVDYVLQNLPGIIRKLRELSPFAAKGNAMPAGGRK